ATGRFAAFGEYVRYHGTVPPRLKELAMITAARAANNTYVWTAREHGVTDVSIDAIRNRTAPDGLTGDDAKGVRFTSELLAAQEIADDTFDAMHQMLKTQSQEKGEDACNKRLPVINSAEVGGFVVQIDSDGPVFAGLAGGIAHGHPSVFGSRQLTRHQEGNALQSQDHCAR